MDYAENIVQLLANLAALLLCLFQYVSNKRRGWLYAIVFFLCSLLSSYYWTTYYIIMRDWPYVSDFFTYIGWNISYLVLFLLVMHMKTPEERRYFHPLMLVPIPLNVWQLTLYLPYGSTLNNVYQVLVMTLLACLGIQGLCWYLRERKNGAALPYVSLAALLFSIFEFVMWTVTSLYDSESGMYSLYYIASFLCSMDYLGLAWAISRSYARAGRAASTTFDRKYQRILKAASAGIVLVFSGGGVLLGFWMRNRILQHPGEVSPRMYDFIPVVLFLISAVLVMFSVAVIFVVYFGQRATENSKLREARRIAERSSAAKSEFLANMSHEIRTPINAVMGMNEMILRESAQARDRLPPYPEDVCRLLADISGHAQIIDTAGRNLLAIINDILDISKIEAGKLDIRENPYTLHTLLNDVCHLIRFRAESRNLAFRVQVDEGLPDNLYGDSFRVRQIILNLLSNAVKYTPRGSVTLIVSGDTTRVREAGQTVVLTVSVRDTGVGIRQEDLAKLFDKFERLALSENSNVEGTGLGLAICRNLLDMMDGSIDVESTYGAGSVFTVRIPQRILSGEAIGSFRENSDAGDRDAGIRGDLFTAPKARILIVDDTRMNLTVAEGILKNTEIRIDTALSGEEALRLCLATTYDLILMDQRMPVMDGTEALSRIRAQENGKNRETPVICLTADAISGAREKYLAQGFTDYLSKPIDSRALRRMLIRCLPAEKVLLRRNDPEENTPESGGGPFAALRSAGIDTAKGLFHCRQDESLYMAVLREFAYSASENEARLNRDFDAGEWKDYAILVHSVKSSAGIIGAASLSGNAARMEEAAKAENGAELRAGHDSLIAEYRRTAEAVRAFCGKPEEAVPEEDAEIMEFAPQP